ncbi:MAG: amidohydrolase family protein [Verrucomicrobiota bacterium]
MLLQARYVLPLASEPILNGAVRVNGNTIESVGSAQALKAHAGEQVIDFGNHILLPGLINAHCHLDYTSLKNAISAPKGFTEWVKRLNSIKRQLSSDDILRSIAKGFTEARRFGTTTICSMVAFPELMGQLPPPPIRTWWFYEMIDIRHRVTSEEVVNGALSFFGEQNTALTSFGLNPHAPYTASLLLYRLARACANNTEMLLTTHVSESAEESEMFQRGSGALYDFLAELERPMHDCGLDTPFGWLWRNGAIGPDWILAHLNELEASDFTLLGALTPEQLPHIVHCPGSHAYFGHRPFPYTKLAGMGVNICVGTDSLASTESLSLLGEIRRLGVNHTNLAPEDLLHTITLNPARALRKEGQLGCIRPGALADLIALPYEGSIENATQGVVDYRFDVAWMMVDGKIS